MTKAEQFMKRISEVHGDDVLQQVQQKAGKGASIEELSAALDKVLLQEHSKEKKTDLKHGCDQLSFDNDLMIP